MESDDGTPGKVEEARDVLSVSMANGLLKNLAIQKALDEDDLETDPAHKLNKYDAFGRVETNNRATLTEQIEENETACQVVAEDLGAFIEQKIYEILLLEGKISPPE